MAIQFDPVKVERIASEWLKMLDAENASAGEACVAASAIFKSAINSGPNPEERAKIRAACVSAINGVGGW